MTQDTKQPTEVGEVIRKTLNLFDFQMINRLEFYEKLCVCDVSADHKGLRGSLSWLIKYNFAQEKNGVYLLNESGFKLKYKIDSFKMTYNCSPFRLVYGRRTGKIHLTKIPPFAHQILSQLENMVVEYLINFESGEPSQAAYDTFLILKKEGLIKNLSGRWCITYHGFFVLKECLPREIKPA